MLSCPLGAFVLAGGKYAWISPRIAPQGESRLLLLAKLGWVSQQLHLGASLQSALIDPLWDLPCACTCGLTASINVGSGGHCPSLSRPSGPQTWFTASLGALVLPSAAPSCSWSSSEFPHLSHLSAPEFLLFLIHVFADVLYSGFLTFFFFFIISFRPLTIF